MGERTRTLSSRWLDIFRTVDDYRGRIARRLATALGHVAAVVVTEAIAGGLAKVIVEQLVKPADSSEAFRLFLLVTLLISAVLIPSYFAVRRDGNSWRWESLKSRLARRAFPDSGQKATAQIEFQVKRRENKFEGQFSRLPVDDPEVLMILKQVSSHRGKDATYTLESLQKQVRRADELIAQKNKKLSTSTRVRWVCFVTNSFRFVAFEDYDIFRVRLITHDAKVYADVLNTLETRSFVQALQYHASEYDFDRKVPIIDDPAFPNLASNRIIPELSLAKLEEGVSHEKALREMYAMHANEVMLVTRGDEKPVGVASVRDVVQKILPPTPSPSNSDSVRSHTDSGHENEAGPKAPQQTSPPVQTAEVENGYAADYDADSADLAIRGIAGVEPRGAEPYAEQKNAA